MTKNFENVGGTCWVGLTTCALLFISSSASAQDWSFEFEPYVHASSIEGSAGIGRPTGVPVNVNFSDIFDIPDVGFMGHFEAHHNSGWGIALDYGFMSLSTKISSPRGRLLDANVSQGVFEALLVRRTQLGTGVFDYLMGARWWDNDIAVSTKPTGPPGTASSSIEEDWLDVVVGVRWTNPLSDNWDFHLRGDVGSLRLESDVSVAVSTGFRYRMSQSVALDLQYKAAWVDFSLGIPKQPAYFKYNTVTHGPVVGAVFRF